VPVLASRVDGNVGLLGSDYPGYFPAGDTRALARLLDRLEREPAFARRLATAVARRAPLFRPARERAAWRRLLAEVAR
jgi:glycosyltransferase involved in cell wall biosynthesis